MSSPGITGGDEQHIYGHRIPAVDEFKPTEEFIALVVNRVVERISGREIREVAREVVPRIAEKLIREALAEEKKN
jgi:hypothetical protein